ncbi:uncharacterized protein LOC110690793 [Chenopodium quinoa]|uniref:uncharacterized protein LOC110690793 n=1 Tax=Chenopodium quinoa TaxID=63459 RepID=UPI000B7741BD|nr:uncharacterized protein LOC110690793 [Chenopodium quinoa]
MQKGGVAVVVLPSSFVYLCSWDNVRVVLSDIVYGIFCDKWIYHLRLLSRAVCFENHGVDRLLREPSSSKGYKTKRLKSLESGSQDEMMQSLPAAKRPKIPKPKRPITRIPDAAVGNNLPTAPYELPSPTECPKCGARKFAFETPHFCCADGEVKIAANECPEQLVRLLTSMDEDAKHFRQYIRLYNNMFAFTSLGGKFDAKTKKGIYVFKLHGQLYHYIPYLLPGKEGPKYTQLYFYDGELEARKRLGCFPELRKDVLAILMEITKLNPYARLFRSLRKIQVTESTQILINKTTVPDQRVYNAPSTDEVAVIWPEGDGSSYSDLPKKSSCHRIMHYFGCYDPLQYPLLFPYGECGWTQGLKKMSRGGIQQLRSQTDLVSSCSVHTTEELLEEEARRNENIVRTKAEKLLLKRARLVQVEARQRQIGTFQPGNTMHTSCTNVGRKVILPPTFIGGPRDLKKRYLNAMALVQRFGKPDLFITMTCNANWPEIKQELAVGEKAQDRPDIVVRIFTAKVLALKHLIKKKKIFGDVAAMIYVIEFQKRGLPHAHFLIILNQDYKIKCPADFDKFVCAEILC